MTNDRMKNVKRKATTHSRTAATLSWLVKLVATKAIARLTSTSTTASLAQNEVRRSRCSLCSMKGKAEKRKISKLVEGKKTVTVGHAGKTY